MSAMGRWVDPRIQSVRVADVKHYLLRHHWKIKPYPRPELLVFEGPLDDNGQPIIQVLPSEEHFVDYQQRLLELISSLAVIEDRYAVDVLNDILRQPVDGQPAGNGPGRSGATKRSKPAPSE
jgi:hypothetical protein